VQVLAGIAREIAPSLAFRAILRDHPGNVTMLHGGATSFNGHLPHPTSASRSKVYEQSLYSWARICDSALTRNFQFCRSIYMTNARIYQAIRENLGSTGCIRFRSCDPYGDGK
jgi:hypothetical protein